MMATSLNRPVASAALSFYRFVFGLLVAGSMLRLWLHGWIQELYINPTFYFKYQGFEWVPHPGKWVWILFLVCGVVALLFAIGLWYRLSAILLFTSFTWIELLDKTNYLNHYYFVSLVLFLMLWMPADRGYSMDAIRKPSLQKRWVPLWTIGSLRLMMAIVYCYAGLTKLNSDWLLSAMPLALWLPAKNDLPIIGQLLSSKAVAYFFSWFGAFYDLFIALFLMLPATRMIAYATVVSFHVLTYLLFPIGVFPFVMMAGALIFFPSKTIEKWVQKVLSLFSHSQLFLYENEILSTNKPKLAAVAAFFIFQLLFPWRYLSKKGELFWTEEGYRFSWRVMLMEKSGYAQFIVKDGSTGKSTGIHNEDFLTQNQEKMMATQPDFILQYAQHLKEHFKKEGFMQPTVFATIYISINGRLSQLYVSPNIDLASIDESTPRTNWLQPFNTVIHGL